MVLVPRVGGLGTGFFQELHWGCKPGFPLPSGMWPRCSRHQRNLSQWWCTPVVLVPDGAGIRPCVARRPGPPLHRDGDLIPCSMTIAFLASLPRIAALLALKCCALVSSSGCAICGWVRHYISSGKHRKLMPVPHSPETGAAVVPKVLATSLAMTPHTGDASPEGIGIRPPCRDRFGIRCVETAT